jgi:small subunit ribosomal protein S6
MNCYSGLYIFLLNGREEGIEEAIQWVSKELSALGGTLRSVQKMDKRRFERVAHRVDSGYYVYVEFLLDGSLLGTLSQRLKGYPKLFRQFYVRQRKKEKLLPKEEAQGEAIAPKDS